MNNLVELVEKSNINIDPQSKSSTEIDAEIKKSEFKEPMPMSSNYFGASTQARTGDLKPNGDFSQQVDKVMMRSVAGPSSSAVQQQQQQPMKSSQSQQ